MPDRKIIKTFPLSEPVEDFDGEMIHELRLSKPRGKDYRKAGGAENDFDMSLRLLACMAAVSDEVIDEIDGADLMPILEYVGKRCLGKTGAADTPAKSPTSLALSPGSTDGRPASSTHST